MPAYYNAKDVIERKMPGLGTRAAVVNSPRLTSNASILIPEARFNALFANKATDIVRNGQEMGERNGQILGVTVKDETFATLQIASAEDQSSDETFKDFILQSAEETTTEKYQLVETFGETVGFFFGTRPKVYRYSGTIMNTDDYEWRDSWKEYYETNLRGTKLVEGKRRAYLTYDYVLREGYVLAFGMSQNSMNKNSVDFNFTMFITKEVNLNPSYVREVRKVASSVKEFFSGGAKGALVSLYGTVTDAIKKNVSDAAEEMGAWFSGGGNPQPGTSIDATDPDEWGKAEATRTEGDERI